MDRWEFVVDGPLIGFLASYKHPWTPEAKRYAEFKRRVRVLAAAVGVPDELHKNCRATLGLSVNWKRRARIDTVNIYKAIEDAMFSKDRRVLDGSFYATEHVGEESAAVFVEIQGGN